MKNILITAGGTSEPIDSVRSITNKGTGRLGSLTADAFAARPDIGDIYYICAPHSCRPQSDRVRIITVESVGDLQRAVEQLFAAARIDAVIHSMAVSDYRVRAVSTVQAAEAQEGSLTEAIENTDIRKSGLKLSSQMDSPLILLEPTPKILSMFRKLSSDVTIVGFKLLSGVTREKLFAVAENLMRQNDCDYVLANDYNDIRGDSHIGYLIEKNGNFTRYATKQEIACGIAEHITEGSACSTSYSE